MASPLSVILEMVMFLIDNIFRTFTGIFGLFGKLLGSLGVVTEIGGPLGFGVSLVIIAVVGYFLTKIVFGGGKKLIILIPAAILLVYIVLLSSMI